MALQTIHVKDATTADLVQRLDHDGAVIVSNVLDEEALSRLLHETRPYIESSGAGGTAFRGAKTTRTGALAARSEACRRLIMDPLALGTAKLFLERWTNSIQLHVTQIIRIQPGQGAQPLHRDRWAWGRFLPKEIEPQFNTMWALTDFTVENGATRVVPGSHRWPGGRKPRPEEVSYAEMERGSVLLFTGTVFHSGGENNADEDRIGINIDYTLNWLRQEENQYLSCPVEIARTLHPDLQELLGYTMANPSLGYYSPPGITEDVRREGTLAPEYALGRAPRDQESSSPAAATKYADLD